MTTSMIQDQVQDEGTRTELPAPRSALDDGPLSWADVDGFLDALDLET